mgnify:CR=1 FL=1
MLKRDLWHCKTLTKRTGQYSVHDDYEVREPHEDYNLIGSTMGAQTFADTVDVLHMPALDIDHTCWVKPSQTPGHYHLFIDVPMTWENYAKLISVMGEVGILEQGYVDACMQEGASFVASKPWVKKAVA